MGKGSSSWFFTVLHYLTESKERDETWLLPQPGLMHGVTLVKFSAVRIFCTTLTLLSGPRALPHSMGGATMSSAT